MKNILIIAPHPDDETLGCGGIIAIKSRAGYEINIIVLSDGSRLFEGTFGKNTQPSPKGISDLRKRETERTVKLLGGDPGKIRYLDYKDGSLEEKTDEIAKLIREAIHELKPEQVYAPDNYEHHPDHNAANVITRKALEEIEEKPEFHQYFLSLKWGLSFDDVKEVITEVDISEFYDLKKEALTMFDCHLKVVLEEQDEPLCKNFNSYLDNVEKFIIS